MPDLVQGFVSSVECALDMVFCSRKEKDISAFNAMLIFLDTGLLQHYYLANLAMSPSTINESDTLKEYFNLLYKDIRQVRIQLLEKYDKEKSDIEIKDAYRLLNLCTYSSEGNEETCKNLLADFPELISIYASSIGYSILPHDEAVKYLSIVRSLGNPEADSWFYILSALAIPDSVLRSKIPRMIIFKSKNKSRNKFFLISYQLLIYFAYRNHEKFRRLLNQLLVNAPGLQFPFDLLVIIQNIDSKFYNCIITNDNVVPYFLNFWSTSLFTRTKSNSGLLVGDANQVKNISDLQDIIPSHIRIKAKSAVSQLFFKNKQYEEWQSLIRAPIDLLLDKVFKDPSRIDPFQYELYYESILENKPSKTSTSHPNENLQSTQFIFLTGISKSLNYKFSEILSRKMKQIGVNCLSIGKSDLVESIVRGVSVNNELIYEPKEVSNTYNQKIDEFIYQNVKALSGNTKKTPHFIIIEELGAIDLLFRVPTLNRNSSIIDINPPMLEYLYCALNKIYPYELMPRLTPLLGDHALFFRVRNRIKEYIKEKNICSIYLYDNVSNADFSRWLNNIFLSILKKISPNDSGFEFDLIKRIKNLEPFTVADDLSISQLDIKLDEISHYQSWIIDNKEDLECFN